MLSPTTRTFNVLIKIEEYKSVPSIGDILIIDPEQPRATLWSRAGGPWTSTTIEGLDAIIDSPALGLQRQLAALYARVTFPPRPRLVS